MILFNVLNLQLYWCVHVFPTQSEIFHKPFYIFQQIKLVEKKPPFQQHLYRQLPLDVAFAIYTFSTLR